MEEKGTSCKVWFETNAFWVVFHNPSHVTKNLWSVGK
jgi:hypothetical protein